MTLLHKTLEKLYFLLENLDPEKLTDDQFLKVKDTIINCPRFTKENIEFYSFTKEEKSQLKRQANILTKAAYNFKKSIYTLELSENSFNIHSYFDEIRKFGLHIYQILGGNTKIYDTHYIAVIMAIENDFRYQPQNISIKRFAENYADRYYNKYGVTVNSDNLRKEYIRHWNKARQIYNGPMKESDFEIVKMHLSNQYLEKLNKYLQNRTE